MKFRSRTDQNRRLVFNWDAINAYTSKWKPETVFHVEIVRRLPKVSDPMRKMYFGYILPHFRELGYEPEDELNLHRHLKILYFNVEPDKHGFHHEKDIPSVFSNESELDTAEKKKFIDWVVRQVARNGVYIDI